MKQTDSDSSAEPSSDVGDIFVYERATGKLFQETVLGDALLKLAYLSPARGVFRLFLFSNAFFSKLLGWYSDTRWSRRKIAKTIALLDIDPGEFRDPVSSFRTFNEFFCRHLREGARPFDESPDVLCCPADCRLTVMPTLEKTTCVPVKGARFTIEELLRAPVEVAAEFAGGTCLVARLCPSDYHRFHYPAEGCELRRWGIDGRLDSVNPIALALDIAVFAENRRIVNMFDLKRFGKVAFVEVGAFGVAGIVHTHEGRAFRKMDEKGLFKFGGSTIVLVFQAGMVEISPDLIENSCAGYETRVLAGENVGRCREQ